MIIFLEGLPGVGKTTLIAELRKKNVHCVDEIIIKNDTQQKDQPQSFFIDNDDQKVKEASEFSNQLVVVDRGPLSTLAYSLVRHKLDNSFDFMSTVNWFSTAKSIYERNNVKVLFLRGKSALPYEDANDPYGSTINQKILQAATLELANIFCSVVVKDYDYSTDQKELIDEILNQSLFT